MLELSDMAKEEWIVFRNKSQLKLLKFVDDWSEKLEKTPTTALTVRLMQELAQYKVRHSLYSVGPSNKTHQNVTLAVKSILWHPDVALAMKPILWYPDVALAMKSIQWYPDVALAMNPILWYPDVVLAM